MESSTQPGPIRIANRLFFLCVAAVILLLFAANRYAGFSFPVPWPDEAHFFWQAYAFYDHSTLFSPVLNTERIIMWMPPGYFVALGTVFKIVGASFAAARACSLVPMLVFFALLVRFLAGYGHRWFALICCTLFFLSGNFIAMGNVVRMEALVIAIVTGSFLLIQQRRFLIAIALLLLTPLFHFNGFYFLLSGLLFIWYKQGSEPRRKQVTKLSLLILFLVVAAWVAYAIFVANDWDGFLHDMQFQFQRKGNRQILHTLLSYDQLMLLGLSVLAWGYAQWAKLRAREIIFLAAPAWLAWVIGLEMWYEVFRSLGYLLMTIVGIHCWFDLASRKLFNHRPLVLFPATVLFLFFLFRADYRSDQIENIFAFPEHVHLGAQSLKGDKQYFTSADSVAVVGMLTDFAGEAPITVFFDSTSDALFLTDLQEVGVNFAAPVFQNRDIDLIVIHQSSRFPSWWQFGDRALGRYGLTRDSTRYMLYSRDSMEQWYFVALSEKMKQNSEYQKMIFTTSNNAGQQNE